MPNDINPVTPLFNGLPVSDDNPLPTTATLEPAHSSSLTTGRNALSTSPEQVIATNDDRLFAEVKNTDESIAIYLGMDNTVSPTTGHLLKAGDAFGYEGYTGPIWAVAESGTPVVTYIEW